jgi:hypothetical protein
MAGQMPDPGTFPRTVDDLVQTGGRQRLTTPGAFSLPVQSLLAPILVTTTIIAVVAAATISLATSMRRPRERTSVNARPPADTRRRLAARRSSVFALCAAAMVIAATGGASQAHLYSQARGTPLPLSVLPAVRDVAARERDTVIVVALDRLGRSLAGIVRTVEAGRGGLLDH